MSFVILKSYLYYEFDSMLSQYRWEEMKKEKAEIARTRMRGVRRTMWSPSKVDQLCEGTRKGIGMSRSRFIVNAIMRYLESLSVISSKPKEESTPSGQKGDASRE